MTKSEHDKGMEVLAAKWAADDALEAELCAVFQQWCDAQGLPQMSADELIHEDITSEQRKYLSDFIVRWNALVYGE